MQLKELLEDVAELDNTVEIRAMSSMPIIIDNPRALLRKLSETDLARHVERIHAAGKNELMVLVK